MSQFWLMDSEGGVLGPVRLVVLLDLAAAGHICRESRISRDGQRFLPVTDVDEVAAVLFPANPDARRPEDQQRAAQVRRDLARFKTLSVNELFGVAEGAEWEAYWQGHLSISSRYHPARLPANADLDLLAAYREVFTFLAERMRGVEHQMTQSSSAPPPAAPAPAARLGTAPARSPHAQSGSAVARPPTGGAVTLAASGDRIQATIDVAENQIDMFVGHRIVNLGTGGFFLPTEERLSLGARLELLFRFLPPPKQIQARGIVVLESAFAAGHRREHGVGVRLDNLSPGDRDFLKAFVERGRARHG